MSAAVADSSSGLHYPHSMASYNHRASGRGELGSPRSTDTDAHQWLYPDRSFTDMGSWPMSQDTVNWSALQSSYINALHYGNSSSGNNNNNNINNSDGADSRTDLQAPSHWLPTLDTQWHPQASERILDNSNAFVDSPQPMGPSPTARLGRENSTASASPHSVFRAPNLGYQTSNLWQRRLHVKSHPSNHKLPMNASHARNERQSQANASSSYANHEPMTSSMGNCAGMANSNGWSVDPNLCSMQHTSRRSSSSNSSSNWDSMISSPKAFNPSMLQQPPHWMQRDRVHSQQSIQDLTSPRTTSSGDNSQPPSLINSSGLSFGIEPSPNHEPSSRIKMERGRSDDGGDSSQDDDQATHFSSKRHRSGNAIPPKDLHKIEASYATLSKSSGSVSLPGTKRNISKVVVSKSRTIDGTCRAADLGSESKETRHLCPHPGCDKHFSTSGHARRHSRIHAALRPFQCPHLDCDATFTRRDNCSQHQKSRHRSQLIAHRLHEAQ